MSYMKDHGRGESDGYFGSQRKLTGSMAYQQGYDHAEQQRKQAESSGTILAMLDHLPPWAQTALKVIGVITGLVAMVASAVLVFNLVLGFGGSTTHALVWAGVAGVAGGVIGAGLPSLLVALAMTAFFLAVFLVGLALVVAGIASAIKLFS
ncbi:MAG TPA: hypothetical protein DEH78_24495 [Solibacterales bacterium]|nr:hypothetical protein [Bryobacterales bacterium]